MKLIIIFLILICINACNINKIAEEKFINNLTDVEKNIQTSENFYLVEKATPSLLIMLDATISKNPHDSSLLLQGTKMHLQYGVFFIEKENPLWASMHYKQAMIYANNFCNIMYNIDGLALEQKTFAKKLDLLPKKSIEGIFLLAASWGTWISVNSENIEILDDLAYVEMLLNKVIHWNDNYENGLPHILLGNIKSREHVQESYFKKALKISKRKFLAIHVSYAKLLGKFSIKKDLFEKLLTEVVNIWEMRKEKKLTNTSNLINSISYNEAKNLLNDIDDFYEEEEEEEDDDDDDDDDDDNNNNH